MKKIIFLSALLVSITLSAQYSSYRIGVNGGIPKGNLENTYSLAFGLDADYQYEVSDAVSLGFATGLIYYSGKENNGVTSENRMYMPLAALVSFNNLADNFYVRGDFGYAIAFSPSGDVGGIYFKPSVGYDFNDSLGINVFYSAIKKEQPTFSYIGLGLMFKI